MDVIFRRVVVGIFCFLVSTVSGNSFSNEEIRLHRHLLNNSEDRIHVRPVYNDSDTIRVNLGAALIQIIDLDEEKQVLDLAVWHRFLWKDPSLAWNPEDYGGIDHTRVPVHKIWRPDIILYNSAFEDISARGIGIKVEALAVVSSIGTVLWIPVSRTKTFCAIDITYFPFDTQTCILKYGSWTFDGHKVDVNFYEGQEEINVDDYIESSSWQLVSHSAVKNVKYYPCCSEPYPDLTFQLKMKRSPGFYVYTLVVPAVLLSFLIPVVFLLPVGRPEKFTLGCTVLISLILMTLLMDMQLPIQVHTSVALINAFYVFNLIFATLAVILSAVVLTIGKFKRDPPYCLKKIVDILSKCCCLETTGAHYRNFKVSMTNNQDDGNNPINLDPDSNNPMSVNPDWITVATVLDRFFFICFFLFLVIGIMAILL